EAEVAAFLEQLRFEYEQENRAFQLVEQVDGWTLVTKPDFALWVRQLYPESKPTRLSGPALETLAIIAYRQPVTRADIEAVRGVAVDGVMQSLLERGLVRIAGRAEVPGRPLLYETTQVFMQHFGLRSLEELPNVDELRRVKLPTATPPVTGELFPPGTVSASGAAAPAPRAEPLGFAPGEPEAPEAPSEPAAEESAEAPAESEPAPELPPDAEPPFPQAPADSSPSSDDHAADSHP
ncbi:MAG: SMC-Scp complex subunit ScpB, partial [Chthoniobacteraceae bacterium]|nr:SMC-Scp complex subunit ScpB [Chthoniobacteraceae bacterium]